MTRESELEFATEVDAVFEDDATVESGLASLFDQRNNLYALLARLYRKEVDEALLEELHGRLYPEESGDADADAGNLHLATYLSNLWEGSLDELRVDYARCFIGHGIDSYSAAYPYESTYTSEKRLLMQAARDEVLAIYRAYGYVKSDSWKDSEDHVAAELEFMRVLGVRTAKALRNGDEERAASLIAAQRNFLHDHLISWVPLMTADMRAFSKTRFYQGLACLTDGVLRTDAAFLNELALSEDEETTDSEAR